MNVNRGSACVRPETGVDLFRLDQLVDHGSGSGKEWTELGGFVVSESRHPRHMPLGLQDQRGDAEWSNGVLDEPVGGLVNHASRQWEPAAWLGERTALTRVRTALRAYADLNRWLAGNVGATARAG